MNNILNKKLDRYELLANQSKKESVVSNPHKFYAKSIDLNKKIIEKQHYNIRKVINLII